jgi:hypothetical protein
VLGIARRLSTWSRGFFPGILGSPNPFFEKCGLITGGESDSAVMKHRTLNLERQKPACTKNQEPFPCTSTIGSSGLKPAEATGNVGFSQSPRPCRSCNLKWLFQKEVQRPRELFLFPVRQTVKSGLCPTSWQRPRRPRPLETAYAQHIRQLHVKGRPVSQFLFRNAVHLRV